MKDEPMTIEALRNRLEKVETELADIQQRMPAHGIKPGFMAALLDLEDERDRLRSEIKSLTSDSPKEDGTMAQTKKSIEKDAMRSWTSDLSTLEQALRQMEKGIQDSISVTSACTNEWCESVEAVIDELTDAIYSLKVPRWADQEQSTRVKNLKKKAREVYAQYMRASE